MKFLCFILISFYDEYFLPFFVFASPLRLDFRDMSISRVLVRNEDNTLTLLNCFFFVILIVLEAPIPRF